MHAVYATEFGPPAVLEVSEVPDPVPGAGEVLLDVAASEVLFLDVQLRQGWGQDYFAIQPPYVPGVGVGGVVSRVGPGVQNSWVGRRIVTSLSVAGEYNGAATRSGPSWPWTRSTRCRTASTSRGR